MVKELRVGPSSTLVSPHRTHRYKAFIPYFGPGCNGQGIHTLVGPGHIGWRRDLRVGIIAKVEPEPSRLGTQS